MSMRDWITRLEGFLTLNDCEILQGAGRVSAEVKLKGALYYYRPST